MKQKIKKALSSKIGKIVIGLLAIILIVGGTFFYLKSNNRIKVDTAQIKAPIISVVPDTAGHLLNISAIEGQNVKKGDVLATTDTSVLRAYSDGLIVKTNKQIGMVFSQQSPVLQMIDPNEIRIVGQVDENKGLNKIKPGQAVSFSVDAISGKTFWGYVDSVSSTANQDQLAFSISSERPVRQFDVYAKFDANKYPEIKNGMSAKMIVYTKM